MNVFLSILIVHVHVFVYNNLVNFLIESPKPLPANSPNVLELMNTARGIAKKLTDAEVVGKSPRISHPFGNLPAIVYALPGTLE